jgi:hypothetical protein
MTVVPNGVISPVLIILSLSVSFEGFYEIYTTQISEQNFHLNPEAEESENSHTSSSQIQRF